MKLDQAKGSLYGLYIGDALGAPLEFQNMDGVDGITDYVDGGVHSVKRGQFTDDTSMTLALMDSLTQKGFNQQDQMERYVQWRKNGKYSSKGFCFDIGITTMRALTSFELIGNPIAGGTEYQNSGNGSLMRLAPVPLLYYKDGLEEMIEKSWQSSVTTHGSKIVHDALAYFVIAYNKILSGEKDKLKIIKAKDSDLIKFDINDLTIVEDIHELNFEELKRYDLKPTGFVVYSMVCAMWCLLHTKTFEEAVLKAVNLGGDSDTIGAITGQLAGAYYGFESIPNHLVEGLSNKDMLAEYTNPFLELIEKRLNE